MFLNNRYYDPQLGIFISVDPMVSATGQPYLYANGNPTTLSDPSGLEPCRLTGSCGGEYADQKVIYDYNQASHERAANCDWNCGRRDQAVSSPADWYMPSQNMYMEGNTVAGLFLLGIVACVVGCAEIIVGCLAALTVCATAVQATGVALAPAALAAANGEPVPYNPIGAGASSATSWINILREAAGAESIDLGGLGFTVSRQRQLRHILDTEQWLARGQGGYFTSLEDAQAVLDATHNGAASILGRTRNGDLLVRFEAITGYNNNAVAGFADQPTNVFIIKGTSAISVVPTSPEAMPAP